MFGMQTSGNEARCIKAGARPAHPFQAHAVVGGI